MRDYSRDLTVFMITVDDGDPRNPTECLECLEKQDCKFKLEVIKNIAPMNAAFQRMLDLCKTKYFIQVDHDMFLYPHGVRTLYFEMQQQEKQTAIYFKVLWDVHLQREIAGVKIYRHDVVKRYPFRDSDSCELDQMARFNKDGYRCVGTVMYSGKPGFPESKNTAGRHGVYWTRESIFRRYSILVEKAIRHNYQWALDLPKEFEDRFLKAPTPLNRAAYLGSLMGIIASTKKISNKELDFRNYGDPAISRLRHLTKDTGGDLL